MRAEAAAGDRAQLSAGLLLPELSGDGGPAVGFTQTPPCPTLQALLRRLWLEERAGTGAPLSATS